MKNIFGQFFTFLFAIFTGFFNKTPVNHKERLIERMARHNEGAYARMREKLQPYAKQFIIPVMNRNKKTGVLEHTKMSRKYENYIRERAWKIKESRGLKWFDIEGSQYLALNLKNAERKYENDMNSPRHMSESLVPSF